MRSSGLSAVMFNKGDPDVQSEPESGSAESEPRPEARSAAGRRPEARTAAAGSEPSTPESQSAGQRRSVNRTSSGVSGRKVLPKGGTFLCSFGRRDLLYLRSSCFAASSGPQMEPPLRFAQAATSAEIIGR